MTHSQIEEHNIIDRYLMRQLPAESETAFVDHYLACPQCVEKLEAGRETLAAIREACAGGLPERLGARRRGRQFILAPAWGLAALLVVAGVWVGVVRRPSPGRPENQSRGAARRAAESSAAGGLPVVALDSYRTGAAEAPKVPSTIAAKAFLLRLNLRGLSSYKQYTLEIVNDSGAQVWLKEGIARSGSDALEVKVEGAPLVPGAFWVRLAGRRPDGSAEFLREYSLLVE